MKKLQPVKIEDEVHVRCEFSLDGSTESYFRQVLFAKFTGQYGHGSGGSSDAHYILSQLKLASRIWRPAGVVLDLSGLHYEWGDEMDWLVPPSLDVPSTVVVGPHCAPAIATLLFGMDTNRPATEATGVFDNLAAAWEAVRYRPARPAARPSRRDEQIGQKLEAIVRWAEDAVKFTVRHTPESFRDDELTHDAVVFTVEMVGRVITSLPERTRWQADPSWGELARLQHHLLRHYWQTDLDHVWEVVQTFPTLIQEARRLSVTLTAEENRDS